MRDSQSVKVGASGSFNIRSDSEEKCRSLREPDNPSSTKQFAGSWINNDKRLKWFKNEGGRGRSESSGLTSLASPPPPRPPSSPLVSGRRVGLMGVERTSGGLKQDGSVSLNCGDK